MFDAVCCINLSRRPERWREFRRRLPKDWPFKEVTWFPATDGQLCPKPPWWTESAGAWGCYRSHYRIIEECLNSGFQSVLIFEDDAVFEDDFSAAALRFFHHLPDDWQMAYLGGQLLREGFRPPVRVNDHVYKPYNVNRTHAYAIRGAETLRTLHEHLLSRDWFERHHIDHHYGRLHQTGRFGVYVPARWLTGQLGGDSDVSGEPTQTLYWDHAADVAARGPEPCVVVLGLHASAASTVADALHRLGVHMGDDLGGAASADDAEDQVLARHCERIAPFPRAAVALPDEEVRDRLEEWLGHHLWRARVQGKLAGGKYPQLCALAPHLLAACGERLKVIDVRQPLDETIAALQARLSASPESRGNEGKASEVQSWLFAEKEKFIAGVPHLSLNADELAGEPATALRRIVEYLGRSPTPDQRAAALAALAPRGSHTSAARTNEDVPSVRTRPEKMIPEKAIN